MVASWRRIEDRTTRWDGRWLAVLTGHSSYSTSAGRTVRRGDERALRWLGFERLQRGVSIRPANLSESAGTTQARLVELGLRPECGIGLLDDLDASTEARARALWNTAALRRDYARSIARLEASRRRLARMPEARAMVESFRLGGDVIRQIVRDPLLPPPLLPAGELAALVREMRAYDVAGRACWRPFLERHGIDFAGTPVELSARNSLEIDNAFGGTA